MAVGNSTELVAVRVGVFVGSDGVGVSVGSGGTGVLVGRGEMGDWGSPTVPTRSPAYPIAMASTAAASRTANRIVMDFLCERFIDNVSDMLIVLLVVRRRVSLV